MSTEIRVIAGVDFSSISPTVVRSGARLARHLGGVCLAVHVVEALRGGEEQGPLLPGLRRWVEAVRADWWTALPMVVLFGGLCAFNCLAIAAWEKSADAANDPAASPMPHSVGCSR